MTRRPSIAVGIATKGRPTLIGETLRELMRQTRQADEIVLCPASAADLPEALPTPCTVVSAPVGLPAQRNAILAATGGHDLLVFFDDDYFPRPDFLAEVEALFARHPDAGIVRGTLIADGIHGTGISEAQARALVAEDVQPATESVRSCYGVYGCNFALRLDLARRHQLRFDEALPLYGWQEDIDFSRQVAPYGEVLISNRLRGVHLGNKGGRTSGLKFGYSQVANPVYLMRKGTMSLKFAGRLMARNLASNLLRSLWSEPHVDRRGRLRGNLIAVIDLLRGKVHPQRILEI